MSCAHAHPPEPSVTLRPATEADFPALIALAQRIWRTHYPSIISEAQIEYMLAGRYTPDTLRTTLTTPNHHLLVALTPALSGFLHLFQQEDESYFIQQCYVDTDLHGQGIGRALLQAAFTIAGPHTVRLHVARPNIKAINAYTRLGMTIEDTVHLPIGEGFFLDDYVMTTRPTASPRRLYTGPTPSLRPATLSDIPAIAETAGRIWRQHYPGIISDAQIDYMLADRYSPQRLQELMTPAENAFHVVTTDDTIRGFLTLTQKDSAPFIERCYLDTDLQGNGIGARMIAEAATFAGTAPLRLQVNRMNIQAIRFYFKQGFHIERTQMTDVGQGFVMDDFIMLRRAEARSGDRASREPARTPRHSMSQQANAETNQKDTPR